ncbi:MAG: aminodeoxychorismate synthase, component I [Desulfuromonas sp.]|nr:MAG: aminodeoxychorismate synthase, component I [Desulfuromonas sp.]
MLSPPSLHSALIYDPAYGWLLHRAPLHLLQAQTPREIPALLQQVEEALANGHHIAGFLAYESASAFDQAFCVSTDKTDFPLAWFGIYPPPEVIKLPPPEDVEPLSWQPLWDEATFTRKVEAIHAAIARGETYQVNLTFPLQCDTLPDDPWRFFVALVHGQRAEGAAYIDTGRFVITSASPELFFEREGATLRCRPMKGTLPRHPEGGNDHKRRDALHHSTKDRAENVMILDMIRNDLARLGGEVTVDNLFSVEKYPTVWQMTSTASTRSPASFSQILFALFPCASITGAPKVRTMELIATLEERPRRIYTGSIGHLAPDGRSRFNVAIRTALFDRESGRGTYGVGAGITWSSEAKAEYHECLAKGRILTHPLPCFDLLESLLWEPLLGYALLSEHLERLAASADYFDRLYPKTDICVKMKNLAQTLPPLPHKVRLLLAANGTFNLEAAPLAAPRADPLRLALASSPVSSDSPFIYHKTTHRIIYETAKESACPKADEVLLWNKRGELTETLTANLVLEIDGENLTPALGCGLLPGTLRRQQLERGTLREAVLKPEDLYRARKVWLINSVRGWREAVLLD